MVPKIHPKGHSFRGAAAYLLHDVGADTSERVAWTETRNLAIDHPETAWRVMAATAMNAAELKRRAGVRATGRKSNAHVLHVTLSWHPEEAGELSHEEMLGSAEAAILALGAEKHQALIVCHDDHEHAHVHLLINRVSPVDGRMLSSSFERLKASEWAQKYEEARGEIFCHQRVINNAARKRGEYVRGASNVPRHLFELARQRANDNERSMAPGSAVQAALDDAPDHVYTNVAAEQRRRDYEVSKRQRELRERQAEQWSKLESDHRQRVADIRAETRRAVVRAKEQVRREFRPQWTELHHEQQEEWRAHEDREASRLGRAQNALRSIDFRRLLQSGERRRALSEAFGAFADRGVRLAGLKRRLDTRIRVLAQEQKRAEVVAAAKQRAGQAVKLEQNRRRFVTDRAGLALTQQMDQAALRAQWRERRKQRLVAFGEVRRHAQKQEPQPGRDGPGDAHKEAIADGGPSSITGTFNRAAPPPQTETSSSGEEERKQKQMESVQDQLKRKREERQRKRTRRESRPRRGR